MAARKKTAAKQPTKKSAAKKKPARKKASSKPTLASRMTAVENKVGKLDAQTTQFGFQIAGLMRKSGVKKLRGSASLKKLMGGPIALLPEAPGHVDLTAFGGDAGYRPY